MSSEDSVADPSYFGTDLDADPDPAIFISDLREVKRFCLLLFEGTFTSFFQNKKPYRSLKTVGFFYYFCLMIEGSNI
jgi:hypothetical protein